MLLVWNIRLSPETISPSPSSCKNSVNQLEDDDEESLLVVASSDGADVDVDDEKEEDSSFFLVSLKVASLG